MRANTLEDRLAAGPLVLLDGALGTELERAGVGTPLPLWTSHALLEAPEIVARVHQAYAEAGAEIVTAGTFRTQRRTLARAGLGDRDAELTRLAITLAREATRGSAEDAAASAPLIAGSAPPLADCYRPDLAPSVADLEREHEAHAQNLARGAADLILVETMNSRAEAVAAARAASHSGLPFFVSFVCTGEGALLSGESLADAVEAVRGFAPTAVLVNCTPEEHLDRCISILADCGLPFGVYPNVGQPNGRGHLDACSPSEFSRLARSWVARGAAVVGGCCGTRPDHIGALRTA
jgi:S-methylmethionine-dependent homocysteine/selenocysteine methylase